MSTVDDSSGESVQFMSQRADAAEFRTPKAPRTGAREPWERTS
jgi:hypothetical protein